MVVLVVGLALFLGMHAVAIVGLREAAVARFGEGPWKGVYSLVSLVGLGLVVWGYGQAAAQPVLVWAPPTWTQHLGFTLMLPVFPLLIAAYAPGFLQRALRHPMLIATLIWATAHLIANGLLHQIVLFGSFGVWAAADLVSVVRRPTQREMPGAPPGPFNDAIAVVVGLGLYVAFLLRLHEWIIGVALLG